MHHVNTDERYTGYDAARTAVAVGARGSRGWVRVWDVDAVSFLHGVLTNDIASLVPGAWRYAAYLTPQGRMVSDMRVLRRADDLVLETEPHVAQMLAHRFDASIFTERVGLGVGIPWTGEAAGSVGRHHAETIVVCGPAAAGMIAAVLGNDGLRLEPHHFAELTREGEPLVLVGHNDLGTSAIDVTGSPEACARLVHDLRTAGASALGSLALEALRIEAGTPRFGIDMTDDTIPLEAGIEGRAISFTKGCYVGQEVIIRILHRGHGRVARRLVGLRLDGEDVPLPGSPVSSAGRDLGTITSAVFSPGLHRVIALGYVHRDASASDTSVTVGAAGTPATVTDLPFRRPE
jgi:folate-binding protein YgfZ